MNEVRVRVAPSPTGDPHVGTAYQALFNRAFARRSGGSFVLRIEDTDQERSTVRSEARILEALRWLGLDWDEGPDVGGDFGPYRQSERLEIYQAHVDELLESGAAYRDFMTRQELDTLRAAARQEGDFDHIGRRDRDLDPEESARRAADGEAHTVRLRVPLDGECVMRDLLRGEIRREWRLVDDQILLKSDGFPTYHLANVVDDHLMAISHVIRGEEWINSIPKHLLLYEAFGWQAPVMCHLPLLRNNDANKSKLSKRRNPTSIDYYRRAGYLPEALVNFLALLGTSREEGEEKFSLSEFTENFELENVTLGGPVFDTDKLRWLNARYIREENTPAQLVEKLLAWGYDRERLEEIAQISQPRLETLGDWGFLTAPFFADTVPVAAEELEQSGLEPAALKEILQLAIWRLEAIKNWDRDSIEATLRELAEQSDVKMRVFTRPFYVALSGRSSSTPLFESMVILGSDVTRTRLRAAIDALGGISGKALKKLEKKHRR